MPKYSAKSTGLSRLLKKHDGNVVDAVRTSIQLRVFRKSWFRKISRKVTRKKTPARWIFVVGCYNSGTKLVTSMFAAHQSVASMPQEGRFFSDGITDLQQGGWGRMMYMNRDKWDMPTDPTASENLKDMIVRDWSPLFNSNADRVVFLDKSICHSVRIPWLNEHFTENGIKPHFIHIVRDGNVVASSVQRKSASNPLLMDRFDDGYPLDMCAEQWVALNDKILDDTKGFENYSYVKFEELVQNPQQEIERLFVEAQLDGAKVAPIASGVAINDVEFEVRTNLNDVHQKRFDDDANKDVQDITKRLMKVFGYIA